MVIAPHKEGSALGGLPTDLNKHTNKSNLYHGFQEIRKFDDWEYTIEIS